MNLVDSGAHKGSTLICMELCTGGTLAQQLIEGKRFAYREILEAFAQICRGVEHMHAQTPPIAHRDLKVSDPVPRRVWCPRGAGGARRGGAGRGGAPPC